MAVRFLLDNEDSFQDGIKHTYTLDGTKILREAWGSNTIVPMYDNEDSVCGIQYNDVPYYFIKNLQGDVIAIVDKDAQTVAKYAYDAWGVCTITQDTTDCNIAAINPYRYRGYYFDSEIGMYYLQSRYYDAGVGRFVNADDSEALALCNSMVGYNYFVYVENSLTCMADYSGFAMINIVCAAIGGLIGYAFSEYVANRLGYYSGWQYVAIRAGVIIGGAVLGWFCGTLIAKVVAYYIKGNIGVLFRLISQKGAVWVYNVLVFLGINPFSLSLNSSKFVEIARQFNNKCITLSYNWAIQMYNMATRFGFHITTDFPHGGYSWHIHLLGGNGKLNNLHIQVVKTAWEWLKKYAK